MASPTSPVDLPFAARFRDGVYQWRVPLVLYSAPAVMRACQAFLDRWFVRLDDDPADAARALVSVRPRGGDLSDAALLHVLDEWFGELLNVELRDDLQATVGRLREIIVGRALHAARPDPWTAQDAGGEDWLEDPLGIAVPWEQKYGKGKKGGEWTYMSGAAGDHPPSDAEHPREKAEAKTELNDAAPAPAPAATVVAVGPGVGPGPVPLPSAGSR